MPDQLDNVNESPYTNAFIGAARDWAQSRTAKAGLAELYARLVEMLLVTDAICHFLGANMDDIVQLARKDRERVAAGEKSAVEGNIALREVSNEHDVAVPSLVDHEAADTGSPAGPGGTDPVRP